MKQAALILKLFDEDFHKGFQVPNVDPEVGEKMKAAFIKLDGIKHTVRLKHLNGVGTFDQQCQLLLATYDVGRFVKAQLETLKMEGDKQAGYFGVNRQLHSGT
ncbi:hypothetical protein MAM1_0061d03804 [Mucor ambiguus]|uniref:Uncharacterized protein n=1 Tax=Mucor ambiguus TaxID=91626 RepID=A0A0C9MAK5_9FUNG|nr:hypothetical protein MAM1_0061d03804 [Mucor ambiguus]